MQALRRVRHCLIVHISAVLLVVGVLVLRVTVPHFVNPGVKINGKYYRETLLKEELLPDMRNISEYFIFQRQLVEGRKRLIFRLKHQLSSCQHSGRLSVRI